MSNERRDMDEANRLYWDSDESVADIAERLDLSRRALYDAVRPAAAGLTCPDCGAELEFGNRSARRSGVAICRECGTERRMGDAPERDVPALAVISGNRAEDIRTDMAAPDLRHRAVVLGGAAIAGVALGTVAAIIATRRD